MIQHYINSQFTLTFRPFNSNHATITGTKLTDT